VLAPPRARHAPTAGLPAEQGRRHDHGDDGRRDPGGRCARRRQAPDLPPLPDACRFTSPFIPISGVALHQVTIYHRSPSAGRGGNRQLNAVLHCIAITRLRLPGPGQTYYQRRRAQGNATGEAVHALKRRIARVVYRQLKLAEQRLATSYL
jgi:hypothetical protein